MLKRVCVVAVFAGSTAMASAPAASAAATTIPATCDNGQSIELVFNGGGNFTPGHLVDGTAMYVTQSIDATQVFTPTGGVAQESHFSVTKPHVLGPVVTCTFDVVRVTPAGTFHGFGTSRFFVTPAS